MFINALFSGEHTSGCTPTRRLMLMMPLLTNVQSKRCKRASKKNIQLDKSLAATGKTDGEI